MVVSCWDNSYFIFCFSGNGDVVRNTDMVLEAQFIVESKLNELK